MFEAKMTPEFRDVRGRYATATPKMLKEKDKMLHIQMRRYVAIAQDEAPKKTGKFARAIHFKMHREKKTIAVGEVFMPQPLGTWVVGGTKAHAIVARWAAALRFFWQKGPRGPGVYLFKSVNHLGTKKDPFTARAQRRWRPGAGKALNKLSKRFVSRVVKK